MIQDTNQALKEEGKDRKIRGDGTCRGKKPGMNKPKLASKLLLKI